MEEFTNSTGYKIFYGLIRLFLLGFSLFLFNMDHGKAGNLILILPLIFLIFGVLIIVSQVKMKIIISADNIVKISAFGRKELLTANVKGCRIGDKVITIEPLSANDSKVIINNYSDLGSSDDLVKWLRDNFTDLDATDLSEEQSFVLNDPSLGFTEREREEKLAKAKQIAIAYNIVGAIIGAMAFFFIDNKVIVILALAYPLLGILIMKFNNGLIKFVSSKKRSVYPFIVIGFYLPVLLLFITSVIPYDIFKYEHIWPIAAVITLTITVLLYLTGTNATAGYTKGQVILMFILSALYGYGSTVQVNCVFDKSEVQVFQATVLDHKVVTGKSNTYYLTLTPWGPEKESNEVNVRKWLYNEVPIGGTVKVNFKKGLLGIPWFKVTD